MPQFSTHVVYLTFPIYNLVHRSVNKSISNLGNQAILYMQTKNRFLSAFSSDQGVSKALILLFISINAIVLFNAIFHDPRIGYDTAAFLLNIDVLSEFRIPLESDTTEFFTPPLPFILPALFEAIMDKVASPEFLSPPNAYWFPTFLHYRFL